MTIVKPSTRRMHDKSINVSTNTEEIITTGSSVQASACLCVCINQIYVWTAAGVSCDGLTH